MCFLFCLKIFSNFLFAFWPTGCSRIFCLTSAYFTHQFDKTFWLFNIWSFLDSVLCTLEKNIHSTVVVWNVLCVYMSLDPFGLWCCPNPLFPNLLQTIHPLFKVGYGCSLLLLYCCLCFSSVLSVFASYI